MRRSIIWVLAIAAMVGCQKESDRVGSSSDELVSFASATIATRTVATANYASTEWEYNDQIAISAPELGCNHVVYEANTGGVEVTASDCDFNASGESIYRSKNFEGDVTYSAYYPISAYDDGSYSMDVADQTEGYLDYDLLYAETTDGDYYIDFTFNHALSLIRFAINDKNKPESYDSQSVTINSVTTDATYKIENGSMILDEQTNKDGSISMYLGGIADGVTYYYAIVHSLSYGGKEIAITLDDRVYQAIYPDYDALEPGKIYTHTITVGGDNVTIDSFTIEDWDTSTENDYDMSYTTTSVWDGTTATGFEGVNGEEVAYSSETTNYYIKTGAQLAYLASLRDESVKGKSFTLLNNIDLADNPWTPIDVFRGTFDGGGYTISGLNIENYTTDQCGLFAYIVEEATVKNLTVEGSVTSSSGTVGGIVGYNAGKVENCINMVKVRGSYSVGGIVGTNASGCTVQNCYNRGFVEGAYSVGGIVGSNNGNIIAAYNTATLDDGAGGVVGDNDGTVSYSFSYFKEEEGTNSINGDSAGNLVWTGIFSDPKASDIKAIESADVAYKSLVDWLNQGSNDSSWKADDNNVNDGFPILTSINY